MSSPWKILGIKAGSDRDTIRRAYAKKLKGVNPEDDPAGFMRLREAHDAALAQLKWRQQWPETEESDGDALADADDDVWVGPPPDGPYGTGPTVPADPPPPPAPDPAALARAAEQADLAARQQALIDAIADGPEGQQAALDHLLAAPALEAITARERIERWLAATLSRRLPASDPLVVTAINLFGWGEIGAAAANPDVATLLQRREEGEFVARIARPHADLNQGYKALSRPPGRRWLMRVSALFGGSVPGEVRQILALADGPLPGIADWLNGDAMAFWRDWLSKPRLRLWMILTMFPLAAVALVAVMEPTGWPDGVKAVFGFMAYAAPFGLLWLLGFRQRFLADWQRPEWQYRAWFHAVPALPLLAAAWPPFAELGPLWLLIVTSVVALTLVSVQRLLPDAPKTLMIGLIRAWPAWALLWVMMLSAALPGWAGPVLNLLMAGMMIIWWQGGDELSWLAQRLAGRWAVGATTGLAALLVGAGWLMLTLPADSAALVPRALALLPLALTLLLIGFRLASGGMQVVPMIVLMAMIQMVIIATPVDKRLDVPAPRPAVAAQPLGQAADWIDGPALLKGAPAGAYRYKVTLRISATGTVARCVLDQPSGHVPLDQAICPDLKRNGRYAPARDGKGNRMASELRLSGGWTVQQGSRPSPTSSYAPTAPAPIRLPEPVISCNGVGDGGTGPMVAEPCMPEQWVQDGEYPAAALALGQSGAVGYRLLVDAQGRVERCDIVESSGHAALDKGTCDLVGRRARFVPARGVDGSPMEWSYRGRIRWQLRDR